MGEQSLEVVPETPESVDVRPSRRGLMIPYGHVITLVLALVAAGANWQKSSGEAAYVRTELDRFERQTDDHFAKSDVRLDAQQTDKLAVLVEQQSKQIEAIVTALSKQAEAQKQDHDSVVKIAAVLEAQAKARSGN